eukprot:SAG11_NODE_5216_length_1627_cov_6.053665_1_plen_74_part_10
MNRAAEGAPLLDSVIEPPEGVRALTLEAHAPVGVLQHDELLRAVGRKRCAMLHERRDRGRKEQEESRCICKEIF